MNRLWYSPSYRRDVRQTIRDLAPWYFQCHIGGGLFTRSWNRETLGQWWNVERGSRKMNRFIRPMLPMPLQGASILEVGANCGANLIWAKKHGARVAIGMEADRRYVEQGRLLHEMGLMQLGAWVFLRDAEIEDIPGWNNCPPYDMAWLFAVLYHLKDPVAVMRNVAQAAKWIVIQGNGLQDVKRGEGVGSITKILAESNVSIEYWRQERHVRGLVVVAKGKA